MQEKLDSVTELILDRIGSGSKPGQRRDGFKLGLVIQGGGMRGVRSGGMMAGLERFGILDAVDTIHSDSSGSCAAFYAIAKQTPEGAAIYYNHLANRDFIDPLRPMKGKPVVDIPFMAYTVMRDRVALKWQEIVDSPIPTHVYVTSSTPQGIEYADLANFSNREQIHDALHWTCRIPILAGWPIQVEKGISYSDGGTTTGRIALQEAIRDSCTHVLIALSQNNFNHRAANLYEKVGALILNRKYQDLGTAYLKSIDKQNQTLDLIKDSANRAFSTQIKIIKVPEDSPRINRTESDRNSLICGALSGFQAVINEFHNPFKKFSLPIHNSIQPIT